MVLALLLLIKSSVAEMACILKECEVAIDKVRTMIKYFNAVQSSIIMFFFFGIIWLFQNNRAGKTKIIIIEAS
jgi:hypothetical protein